MSKTPLTQEILDKFGPGDQLQLLFPETGGSIVAEITRISLKPKPGNNDQELRVDIQYALEFLYGGRVRHQPSLAWYDGPLLSDLVVSRQEVGYLEIPHHPAEQIIIFVKSSHIKFMHAFHALQAKTRV